MKKFVFGSLLAVSVFSIGSIVGASPSGTLYTSNPITSAPTGHTSTYTNDWGTAEQVSAKTDATKGAQTNSTNWVTRTDANFADSGSVSGPSYWAKDTNFDGYCQVIKGSQVWYATAHYTFQ